MSRHVDLLIVGAGPAGMSAAIVAKRHGLDVLVVDEQPSPGGQIWRNIENVTGTPRAGLLGKAYGRQGLAQRQARQLHARLQQARIEQIFQGGLHEFITEFIDENNRIGARIAEQYLM
mgnify:CR=1 FL=1